ncbi:sodium/calcium exchanger 2 isoform X3 [Patagioenas fasciata]|uniref:sodium/calcium exchanger 2 isoform X2 n=1 Tax=Patagioenas fasciata TaxID=372321 RepID=UPI003A98E44D
MRALRAALAASLLLPRPGSIAGAAEANGTCQGSTRCQPGVLLPVWQPDDPSPGDTAARAVVYFVAMMYMFLGVSIIADRFMASIEVITSKEKEITITKANGETSVGTVRIWNETVSNLTLMALGSSAPEILLSVIEVCGHNFQAGELGPGTIVGSAAFNMFVVIAVCVYVIPSGESRKIKHLRVFFVTASWSIFAYVWLYLILAVISPGVVQVWEALLTLVFFPVCVVFAWAADKRLLFYKYVYKRYRADPRRGVIIGTEAELPKGAGAGGAVALPERRGSVVPPSPVAEEKELDESRREMIQILKELKQKHPDKELEQLVDLANYQALLHQQKSRAFYRIQATRLMTGAGNVLKKHVAEAAKRAAALLEVPSDAEEEPCSRIFFEPCLYHCLENCGSVTLSVACRHGAELNHTFYVDYKTEDGSAKAGSDYEYSEGTLIFKPGETQKELTIGIIDDDIFEEDEHFFVRLLNLRVGDAEGMFEPDPADGPKGRLVAPAVATVTILDDDHAGIFTFRERLLHVSECQGTVEEDPPGSHRGRRGVRETGQFLHRAGPPPLAQTRHLGSAAQPRGRGPRAVGRGGGGAPHRRDGQTRAGRELQAGGHHRGVLRLQEHGGQADQENQPGHGDRDPLVARAVPGGHHGQRRRGGGGGGRARGAVAVVLRLRDALPDGVLEGSVRLRAAHRLLQRLGLLRRLHPPPRAAHRAHRGPGRALRLHRGAQGLGQRRGLRGAGDVHS